MSRTSISMVSFGSFSDSTKAAVKVEQSADSKQRDWK